MAVTGAPTIKIGDVANYKEGMGSEPFLAVVACDEWVESDKVEGGIQWHLAVKPADIPIKGATGAFHTFYKPSEYKNSKMGAALAGLTKVFDDSIQIGVGQLLGKVCWWERKDIPYGTNKESGEQMVAKGVLVPVRTATDAEIQHCETRVGAIESGTPAGQAPTVEAADVTTLSVEDAEAILGVLEGKKKRVFQIAAAKSTLHPSLKQAIIDGTALEFLLETGMATLDEEGAVVRAA